METTRKVTQFLIVVLTAGMCLGCAEAKIGIGPFKAASVEVGPGGVEAKGPSAGPFKATSAEVGPGGAEAKGPSAGPLGNRKAKSQPSDK
jgi:hypothetical protein